MVSWVEIGVGLSDSSPSRSTPPRQAPIILQMERLPVGPHVDDQKSYRFFYPA